MVFFFFLARESILKFKEQLVKEQKVQSLQIVKIRLLLSRIMMQQKPVLLLALRGGRVTAVELARGLECSAMTRCRNCFHPQDVHLLGALFLQRLKSVPCRTTM